METTVPLGARDGVGVGVGFSPPRIRRNAAGLEYLRERMRGAPPSSSTFTAQIVKISSLGQLPRLRVFSSSFSKLRFSFSCLLCSRTLILCMNLGRTTSLVFTILLPPGWVRLGCRGFLRAGLDRTFGAQSTAETRKVRFVLRRRWADIFFPRDVFVRNANKKPPDAVVGRSTKF